MRIINVIELWGGVIDEIYSFPIFEEQLSQDVIDNAESKFIELVKGNDTNFPDEILELAINEKHYENKKREILILWSNVMI